MSFFVSYGNVCVCVLLEVAAKEIAKVYRTTAIIVLCIYHCNVKVCWNVRITCHMFQKFFFSRFFLRLNMFVSCKLHSGYTENVLKYVSYTK